MKTISGRCYGMVKYARALPHFRWEKYSNLCTVKYNNEKRFKEIFYITWQSQVNRLVLYHACRSVSREQKGNEVFTQKLGNSIMH